MVYIKQITIQGFKSYKEQTIIDTFSARHNVVVGRNGSGKSNFFAAIRFVLSDAYTNMSREERQALLHEGSGTAVMSAYVEIIFDNADNRFPTGKDEVVLRRTIGLKKDEYSLDKKSASKSDVMNLLESAGFSRSNPYYIVPQGRITTLTNAKDSERLVLLKEVAGTQVYEQRRKESFRILDETTQKRAKIDDLLKYIEERIAELEEEKEELRDYQQKDKEKRCLEYTIYSREQQEVNTALEEIESVRVDELNSNDDLRDAFVLREQRLSEIDLEISSLRQQLSDQSAEKLQLEQDRRDHFKKQSGAELIIGRLESESESLGLQANTIHSELEATLETIASRESQLDQLKPEYNRVKTEELSTKEDLDKLQAQIDLLYGKQGRNAKFRNRAERNQYLNVEMSELEASVTEREEQHSKFESELQEQRMLVVKVEEELVSMRSQLEGRSTTMKELTDAINTARQARDQLYDERKELWREESKHSSALELAREEWRKAERTLQSTMDQSTYKGLAAAKRIAKEKNLSGYYGPICELFQVDDRYRTAVEVTAGASLFHIVVDDDETAATLLDGINREKAGRVTFVPLNRVRTKSTRYPDADDAIPIMQKIRYDPELQKAMQQVFGKSIICPNLEIASKYARSEGLNAITLTGDKADKKGALTGGYHDSTKSRLQSVTNAHKWEAAHKDGSDKLESIQKRLQVLEQQVTRAISELERSEARKKSAEQSWEPLQRAVAKKTKEVSSAQDALGKKETALGDANNDIQRLKARLDALLFETRADFKKTLTEEEQLRLQGYNESLNEKQLVFTQISSQRLTLEGRKVSLESELQDNLYLRRDRLVGYNSEQDSKGSLETNRQIRSQALRAVTEIARRLEAIDSTIEDLEGELTTNLRERTDVENQNREDAKLIDRQQKLLERKMQKKSLLMLKKDECTRNIRDLGILPEEAFEKYAKLQSETLVKRLHKVHTALKKYSHVNKKAFDQYNNFTKQRDQLLTRHEELEGSQTSITDLIDVLDQRKDEAIERTFKQVSKAFAEIFERLVPAGRGRLVIQRKVDREDDEDLDEDEREDPGRHKNAVENYVGIAISVSFNSKEDEQQRIQQLSGGQKSLCALALIFAIQRCDPAPFYLMDEVDAALDAQYRTAVASMLHELSETGQFICTTFRPEMIQTADKFYGVFFQNKISTVKTIEREDALQFIDSEAPR